MQTTWTAIRRPGFYVSSVSTTVPLDFASDRSYISKALADKLGAEPVDVEMLRIMKLRQQDRAESFESSVIELETLLRDDSFLMIYASVISPVIGRIRRYPVDMGKWGSFFPKKITLADWIPESKEWASAELLIGGDYYVNIALDGRNPIGESGSFLRNSKLGAIVTWATPAEDPANPKTQTAMGCCCVSDQVSLDQRSLPSFSNTPTHKRLISLGEGLQAEKGKEILECAPDPIQDTKRLSN